jgi:hypothetical protein
VGIGDVGLGMLALVVGAEVQTLGRATWHTMYSVEDPGIPPDPVFQYRPAGLLLRWAQLGRLVLLETSSRQMPPWRGKAV